MLTNEEIYRVVDNVPITQQYVLAVARAIEAKVLEKHQAFEQGKTCRTCAHLDSDPRHEPCAGCRDFARRTGPTGVARRDEPKGGA